jgi:hypothetical protein
LLLCKAACCCCWAPGLTPGSVAAWQAFKFMFVYCQTVPALSVLLCQHAYRTCSWCCCCSAGQHAAAARPRG